MRATREFYGWLMWAAMALYLAFLWASGGQLNLIDAAVLSPLLLVAEWPRGRALVIYDGECGFCVRAKRFLERLDWGRVFQWLPLQAPWAQELGIPIEALQARLHLIAGDRVWTGFAAFRAMALYNPLSYFVAIVLLLVAAHFGLSNWLMAALLLLFAPFLTPAGEAVYDWVARNRYRIPPRTCKTQGDYS